MLIAILGRQSAISVAELSAVFGDDNVRQVGEQAATILTDPADLSILGGTIKIGRAVATLPLSHRDDSSLYRNISHEIVRQYQEKWSGVDHKITLGISTYGFSVSPRDVQKTGLLLKSALKKSGTSLRLIPNSDPDLSTATSHNNKLGLSANKVELLIIKTKDSVLVAESLGAQNITAYAKRDQARPKRDAFVGMLPPKLAQIMLNLALSGKDTISSKVILDPFCGTGTVPQEALLRGLDAIGTDLSDKMISYTNENIAWLKRQYRHTGDLIYTSQADAMTYRWPDANRIDAVVCETYLGQPFSAPPSPEKLREVTRNCNHIISQFLSNIHSQLQPNTPLCIAVPAWRSSDGRLTHLPLIRELSRLGYGLTREPLVYSRPDQVVARELLVIKTK